MRSYILAAVTIGAVLASCANATTETTSTATTGAPPVTSPPPGTSAPATPAAPDPIRSVRRNAHPGFDARRYPGEAALRAWRASSPYEWVGYYLVAPCQTGTTWVGKRNALREIGFGTAVIFVGEQDWSGPPSDSSAAAKSGGKQCTVGNLTAAKGAIDAARADSTMAAEGFGTGTTVFLDVERVESVSPRLTEYIRAWVHGMLASGRYTPGIYVHERNAPAVRAIASAEYTAASRDGSVVPFWIATRNDQFNLDSATPATSTFNYATVWQGLFNVAETWGGVTLTIDANVATAADPSGGQ